MYKKNKKINLTVDVESYTSLLCNEYSVSEKQLLKELESIVKKYNLKAKKEAEDDNVKFNIITMC